MLKDHVDFEKLMTAQRAFIAGEGPAPAPIATWRKAKEGERCDGCGREFPPGSFVQVAYADGSVGHAACHVGGDGIRVTFAAPTPNPRARPRKGRRRGRVT